ncbi:MAG: alpha/beta hydrolase, partial [Gammaproteobacteria bacterium]
MRSNIAFEANGTTLRGWFYTPDVGAPPFPTVVMAHGFTALKEMGLDDYAAVFTGAGLACLVYDHRNFGDSDGTPRHEIDPIAQMRDYRHALTFAESRPEVAADRLGIWGTSYSGGLVLMAAAVDRRVRCVVSQVPFIGGCANFEQLNPSDQHPAYHLRLAAERRAIATGATPTVVEVCTDDPTKPENSAGRTYRYFDQYRRAGRGRWENKVTLRSLDFRFEFDALPFMPRISPTPLLMLVATDDTITPTAIALDAFERARAPKKLLLLEGHHYVPYHDRFD